MTGLRWRSPTEDDHPRVLAAVQGWWDDGRGADLASLLPRLFFQHFGTTSVVVHDDDRLVAFLIGFLSQSREDEAYVHFVGVDPGMQGQGLGRSLYDWFFDVVRAAGRTTVHAVTSPENTRSQEFHRRMGFTVSSSVPDYDGPGSDRVVLTRVVDLR